MRARARDTRLACFRVKCLEPFLVGVRVPQVHIMDIQYIQYIQTYIHQPPRFDTIQVAVTTLPLKTRESKGTSFIFYFFYGWGTFSFLESEQVSLSK